MRIESKELVSRFVSEYTWNDSRPLKFIFYDRVISSFHHGQYNTDGIYILLDCNEVVYVGQSNDLLTRVRQHRGQKSKIFDSVALLHMDYLIENRYPFGEGVNKWKDSPERYLIDGYYASRQQLTDLIEKKLIRKYRPKYNKRVL